MYGVHHEVGVVRFITEGYGPGESVWQWPYGPSADVRWHSSSGRTGVMQVQTDASGLLPVGLPQSTGERVEVTIAGSGADRASR